MDAQGGDDGGEVQDCGRGGGEGGRWIEFGDGGTVDEGELLESTEFGVAEASAGTDDGDVVAMLEGCGGWRH